MKLQYAAGFTGIVFTIAALYTITLLRPGLALSSVTLNRQAWLDSSSLIWVGGWWLWLVAIFSWMLLLVTFMWSYSPAHRIATMLQSGLVIIAAVLAICGVIAWMRALPVVLADAITNPAEMAALVDALALGLLGGGLFMGGVVTAWIGFDLLRLKKLTWPWLAPGIASGLCAIPSPFVLPQPVLLIVGLLCWIGWSAFLATRSDPPRAYTEWKGL